MNLLNKALRHVSGWSRTTWCLAILMTVAFVLIGRLAQLQVFDTFDLEKKNLLQVQVDRKLQSPRGTIYDRNGKPLAMSVVTKSLYADPKMIKQSPQEIAELISPYVTMSKENIVKALQEDSAFVWINRMRTSLRRWHKSLRRIILRALTLWKSPNVITQMVY